MFLSLSLPLWQSEEGRVGSKWKEYTHPKDKHKEVHKHGYKHRRRQKKADNRGLPALLSLEQRRLPLQLLLLWRRQRIPVIILWLTGWWLVRTAPVRLLESTPEANQKWLRSRYLSRSSPTDHDHHDHHRGEKVPFFRRYQRYRSPFWGYRWGWEFRGWWGWWVFSMLAEGMSSLAD